MRTACKRNDLANRIVKWLLWGVPIALFVFGGFVGAFPCMLLWTPALLVAGTACVVNAARCGRLHCYLTGPLYLAGVIATLLVGLEFAPPRWNWIAMGVVGGTVLSVAPEWVRGQYHVRQRETQVSTAVVTRPVYDRAFDKGLENI